VHGLIDADAHRAIDEAFGEISLVHRLMSFHEAASDVSRLNREACGRTSDVHPATFEVLHWAREIAEASGGCFDITVAAKLVAWGILPPPDSPHAPDPHADWRDIELGEDFSVRFRRPLWIDLGGVAKGYAVDRAIEKLRRHGATEACVNAGGDLKIYGPEAEVIALRPEHLTGKAYRFSKSKTPPSRAAAAISKDVAMTATLSGPMWTAETAKLFRRIASPRLWPRAA
jgi:thiamine biosynthesis lipoprotein